MSDLELAQRLAATAGRLLVETRDGGLILGKELGNAGDAIAHQWLSRALADQRPDDGFLSEEAAADPARLEHSRVWIVDPLDGTREYAEGRADWAVHVALTIDGDPRCSAVGLPGIDAVFSTGTVTAPPTRADGPLRIAVSRSRPPELVSGLAARLEAELVPMGSAGWKIMAVVRGEVDAYVHAGGQYEWDSAAPIGIARAAGLYTSRVDGSPLSYAQPDPWLPDLVVCRPEFAPELMAAIAAETEESNR